MSNKVLVIGGSRFVGPYLLDLLSKDDNEITVFNRGTLSTTYPKASFVQGDRNLGFDSLKGRHFDVVYDTCAYNGEQTKRLLDEVDFDFLVHFGTVASYSLPTVFPVKESQAQGIWPCWGDYGKGKAGCEAVLASCDKKHAILRPVYILGPKNYCDRENFIYGKLTRGETILVPGDGQALNQFVFADEVAQSLYRLGKNKIEGAFNCAGDDCISLVDLVKEMAKISGKTAVIEFDLKHDREAWDEEIFPFANEKSIFDNQLIKKTLGITFAPLLARLKQDWESFYKDKLTTELRKKSK